MPTDESKDDLSKRNIDSQHYDTSNSRIELIQGTNALDTDSDIKQNNKNTTKKDEDKKGDGNDEEVVI